MCMPAYVSYCLGCSLCMSGKHSLGESLDSYLLFQLHRAANLMNPTWGEAAVVPARDEMCFACLSISSAARGGFCLEFARWPQLGIFIPFFKDTLTLSHPF